MWSPPCTSHPSTGCAALPPQGAAAQSKVRLLIQAQGNSTGVMRIKSRITRPININSTAEPPELGTALATALSCCTPCAGAVSEDCDTNFRQNQPPNNPPGSVSCLLPNRQPCLMDFWIQGRSERMWRYTQGHGSPKSVFPPAWMSFTCVLLC